MPNKDDYKYGFLSEFFAFIVHGTEWVRWSEECVLQSPGMVKLCTHTHEAGGWSKRWETFLFKETFWADTYVDVLQTRDKDNLLHNTRKKHSTTHCTAVMKPYVDSWFVHLLFGSAGCYIFFSFSLSLVIILLVFCSFSLPLIRTSCHPFIIFDGVGMFFFVGKTKCLAEYEKQHEETESKQITTAHIDLNIMNRWFQQTNRSDVWLSGEKRRRAKKKRRNDCRDATHLASLMNGMQWRYLLLLN